MPTVLKLDASGDLAIEDNKFVVIEKSDAIRQRIQTRLRSFTNEWFLARTEGVPYLAEILVHSPNFAGIDALLGQAILDTPGVLVINDLTLTFDRNSRRTTVTFEARLEGDDENTRFALALPP